MSPCEYFPEKWIAWDQQLQKHWSSLADTSKSPWLELHWLTENVIGKISLFALGLVLVYFLLKRVGALAGSTWPKRIYHLGIFVLLTASADFMSSNLKVFFGRLKPHVKGYHPHYMPALSFPSNHAFNSFFIWTLFLLLLSTEQRKRLSPLFVILFCVVAGVAISRVFLGEHYLLDVTAGAILGALYAMVCVPVFDWFSQKWPSSKKT